MKKKNKCYICISLLYTIRMCVHGFVSIIHFTVTHMLQVIYYRSYYLPCTHDFICNCMTIHTTLPLLMLTCLHNNIYSIISFTMIKFFNTRFYKKKTTCIRRIEHNSKIKIIFVQIKVLVLPAIPHYDV